MSFLGRLFGKKPNAEPPTNVGKDYNFKWYEPGEGNPFGIRLLDCRSLTWNVVATTKDPAIAKRYVSLRQSHGRDLVDSAIPESIRRSVSLKFPHNGAALEGIVYKAPSMEVKWDIYIYDSIFLFARSWTGELCYRATAVVGESEIEITNSNALRQTQKWRRLLFIS